MKELAQVISANRKKNNFVCIY